jgi:GGDEF domain-containing protein
VPRAPAESEAARGVSDRGSSPRRAGRRSRRFVLPDDHPDPRTSDRIEAFLDGPGEPSRKRTRNRGKRLHRPIRLDTRLDWDAALLREDARTARYGRPVTVAVVDVRGPVDDTGIDLVAVSLGETIRNEARETDRCARVGAMRFHLLLPETPPSEAARFTVRLHAACVARLADGAAEVSVRIEAVSPILGQTLADALALAESRLAE